MSRIPLVRRIVALLFILAVAAPLTAAPIKGADQGLFEAAAPFVSFWAWLSHAWAKNGCAIDPNGRCLPGTAPASPDGADNGCAIDPHGGCHSAASPLLAPGNGCGLDPWGRCGS